MQGLVEVTDLHVRYGAYEAVKGVSFSLGKGEIFGIVGESGSGKSTIAKTLMGLTQSSGGSIAWGSGIRDQGSGKRGVGVQMIFQDAVGSLNPRMTVRQTLEEVLRVARKVGPVVPNRLRGVKDNAPYLLDLVGLSPAILGITK